MPILSATYLRIVNHQRYTSYSSAPYVRSP